MFRFAIAEGTPLNTNASQMAAAGITEDPDFAERHRETGEYRAGLRHFRIENRLRLRRPGRSSTFRASSRAHPIGYGSMASCTRSPTPSPRWRASLGCERQDGRDPRINPSLPPSPFSLFPFPFSLFPYLIRYVSFARSYAIARAALSASDLSMTCRETSPAR
jgi:hypothetical protein